MSRAARLAAALGALLLVAGCTSPPVVARSSPAPASPVPSGATTAGGTPAPASGDLAAAKRAAGIADCPRSDAGVAPVTGGLPDVVLPCLGGGRSVRLAGLRGRPLVVNVWASWCGPCRQEAPYLAEVARTDRSDLLVLGIDHDDPEPAAAIAFAASARWTYPQLQDRRNLLRAELQVAAIPQTLFVRADGTIAHRNLVPFSSADQLRTLAQRYLGVAP